MRQALRGVPSRLGGVSVVIGVRNPERKSRPGPFQLVTGRVWKGTAFGRRAGPPLCRRSLDWYMNGKIEIDPMITTSSAEEINKDSTDARRQVDAVRSSCSNQDVKHKEDKPMTVHIHPSVDNGVAEGSGAFAGGTLVLQVQGQTGQGRHQGRWSLISRLPAAPHVLEARRATFSVVAVVPRENVTVLENGDKLQIVDTSAAIQRYACKGLWARICTADREQGTSLLRPSTSSTRTIQEAGSAAAGLQRSCRP